MVHDRKIYHMQEENRLLKKG